MKPKKSSILSSDLSLEAVISLSSKREELMILFIYPRARWGLSISPISSPLLREDRVIFSLMRLIPFIRLVFFSWNVKD